MKRFARAFVILLLLLSGAGAGALLTLQLTGKQPEPVDEIFARQPVRAEPDALAVFPCTSGTGFENPYAPCLLISAGGKRLVFGAPLYQDWHGVGSVDAAFLFNGHPLSSGGLNGLRLETWRNGRTERLLVISGDLQLDAIRALDDQQAGSDALVMVEHQTRLEFVNAGTRVKPVPATASDFRVFDTGDVVVTAASRIDDTGDQIISYDLHYGGQHVRILPCGAGAVSGPADILITPGAEKSRLAELIRDAHAAQNHSDVADLQHIGRSCPSELQAISRAEEIGAGRLILLRAQRDGSLRSKPAELKMTALEPAGIVLSGN